MTENLAQSVITRLTGSIPVFKQSCQCHWFATLIRIVNRSENRMHMIRFFSHMVAFHDYTHDYDFVHETDYTNFSSLSRSSVETFRLRLGKSHFFRISTVRVAFRLDHGDCPFPPILAPLPRIPVYYNAKTRIYPWNDRFQRCGTQTYGVSVIYKSDHFQKLFRCRPFDHVDPLERPAG